MLLRMNTVSKNLLTKSFASIRVPERNFYGFLLNIFNRPSASRIKEVGPDRACAEWLLRNGAAVRWKGSTDFIRDYNCLPLTKEAAQAGSFYIEDVDATDAAIADQGFGHFENCNHVKKITLVRNHYMSNGALFHLNLVSKTLNFLQIQGCASISDAGLRSLAELKNLKTLHLQDLQSVKDKEKIISELKSALPGCSISYPN